MCVFNVYFISLLKLQTKQQTIIQNYISSTTTTITTTTTNNNYRRL